MTEGKSLLEGMNSAVLVFAALCVFAIAYRFYGLFIATKVLRIDPSRRLPSESMADGLDYHKTNRYVLFGHHFAAIAGAGPLTGPVLAAQFGFLPGALWILIGAVIGGAVHDIVVLFASVRHRGESLANIARNEIGRTAGTVSSIAFLLILILTIAGASIAMTNAISESPWGMLVVASTIPTAILMGIIMKRPGSTPIIVASCVGVAILFLTVFLGSFVAGIPALASFFSLSKKQISLLLPVYAFAASVLPVWLLLAPRDYLSTFLKVVTIAALTAGIIFLRPDLQMPPLTRYIHGGGPVVPGAVFPFIFITIACGAISGFHATIASGTTPKMIASEKDILFVGYGAMLFEGVVAMMALIAASVLVPADYFAINSSTEMYSKLGMHPFDLPWLSDMVEEQLQGRPGGAVSLAVGIAYIFSKIPSMDKLMSYWYHFAIMFEAVFILTLIDAGTRAGRFLLQEMTGKVFPRFNDHNWLPGMIITGVVFTLTWGYLLYTGSISTIWPLFGISNQLLAACALIIVSTMLVRLGRKRYIWITLLPGIAMAVITLWAGYINITVNYLPQKLYLLAFLCGFIMLLIVIIIVSAGIRIKELLAISDTVTDNWGDRVLVRVEDENPH
ncbi:MAG: Carbon starvation protein A [Syntrophorhabdus sp. PtaU1.Bin058]|nr:MAG: Carbon starvation protein A [Syntrophorhabdus sp. PtaU1.Bin058]